MNRKTKKRLAVVGAMGAGLLAFLFTSTARAAGGVKPVETPEGGKRWGGGGKSGGGGGGGGASGPRGSDFNPSGPGLWISEDCSEIVEGARFWPNNAVDRNPWLEDEGRFQYDPDVADGRACKVLSILGLEQTSEPDCTGLDYVDTKILEGIQDPIDIARSIAEEVAPLCFDQPSEMWTPAFSSWYNSLVDRLTYYVEEKLFWLEDRGML